MEGFSCPLGSETSRNEIQTQSTTRLPSPEEIITFLSNLTLSTFATEKSKPKNACSTCTLYTERLNVPIQSYAQRGSLLSNEHSPFSKAKYLNDAWDWTGYLWHSNDGYIGSGAYAEVYKASWRQLSFSQTNPPLLVVKEIRFLTADVHRLEAVERVCKLNTFKIKGNRLLAANSSRSSGVAHTSA